MKKYRIAQKEIQEVQIEDETKYQVKVNGYWYANAGDNPYFNTEEEAQKHLESQAFVAAQVAYRNYRNIWDNYDKVCTTLGIQLRSIT